MKFALEKKMLFDCFMQCQAVPMSTEISETLRGRGARLNMSPLPFPVESNGSLVRIRLFKFHLLRFPCSG